MGTGLEGTRAGLWLFQWLVSPQTPLPSLGAPARPLLVQEHGVLVLWGPSPSLPLVNTLTLDGGHGAQPSIYRVLLQWHHR